MSLTESTKAQRAAVDPAFLEALQSGKTAYLQNPHRQAHMTAEQLDATGVTHADIDKAASVFARAQSLFKRLFSEAGHPDLHKADGEIESPLEEATELKKEMGGTGNWFLKRDDQLPVAGSIKGRGAFYAVLEHAEKLALQHGLIEPDGDLGSLADEKNKAFFAGYGVRVGSTGNLGMAIGLLANAIGFMAKVYLSRDRKEWKETRLTKNKIAIDVHDGDFKQALQKGRSDSANANKIKPGSDHFVDDENSKALSVGPTVAARRLKKQLDAKGLKVDAQHPLFVYVPTGVGGGPSGVARGLADVFGTEHVHVVLVQPTHCAGVLARLSIPADRDREVDVYHLGLDNQTEYGDGMAVPQASNLAMNILRPLVAGGLTVPEHDMLRNTGRLHRTEGAFVESSAAAAISGPSWCGSEPGKAYIDANIEPGTMDNATHIMWFTGGGKVPPEERDKLLAKAHEADDAAMRDALSA